MLKGASEDLEEYTKQAYQSVKEWGTQQFNYWTDLNEWENAIKSYGDWRTWAYNLPVSGDCNRASICFDNGDYGGGLFNWGMGFVNAFTLGYGSGFIATSTNTLRSTAVRSTTQEVVEQVGAKGGGTLLNTSEKYVVIGKYPDYINFASKYKNATVLDLPNKWTHLPKQEAAKFLWKQNSSQLRGALRNGYIPFDIGYGGQFYNAEKLILENKGLSLQGNIWIK